VMIGSVTLNEAEGFKRSNLLFTWLY
jgi:hypothetical protein